MGRVYKLGDVYYIEFTARGLLYSQIGGADLRSAEALLAQVEAKISSGEALTIERHIQWDDFADRFMKHFSLEFPPVTMRRFESVLKDFRQYLHIHYPQIAQLASVTPVVVEGYKVELMKQHTPKIVNLTILLLREIFEFGIKLGFLNDNPSLHVRLLPWPQRKTYRLSPRYHAVCALLTRGIFLGKAAKLLQLNDAARLMFYANLIPLSREEMYLV